MTLNVPKEVLEALGGTEQSATEEIAVVLYKAERISASLAAELAGTDRMGFYRLLDNRGLGVNYTEEDVRHDFAVVRDLAGKLAPR
ncbi:MAG: UPF0175 family protein [Planctomycetes bacterium]|nr:UPF0175 family protein [Planctomycetota bacterium]